MHGGGERANGYAARQNGRGVSLHNQLPATTSQISSLQRAACWWHSQWVCVTLGEIPRWRSAQRGRYLQCKYLKRKRLRLSRPPIFFLPGICEKKTAGQRIWAAGDKRAQVGSMPECLAVTAEGESIRPSSSLNMISVPLLWETWSRSVRVTAK